jgi:hypothetical protein
MIFLYLNLAYSNMIVAEEFIINSIKRVDFGNHAIIQD